MGGNKLFENAEELVDAETVEVVGQVLPPYTNGVIIRNGPGKFDLPSNFTVNNFYDGYTILTRLEIRGGKLVSLTKKFLDSEAHRKAVGSGKPCYIEFCTRSYADPEKSILVRHLPDVIPVFSDNGNTSIFKIGKNVFTCAETCNFQHVNSCTLSIAERYDSNAVFGLGCTSAHPSTDPDTGIVYNIGPSMYTGLKYHMLKIDPTVGELGEALKESEVFGGIPSSSLSKFSYIHSFGMSQNFIVILEQPYQASVPKIIAAAFRAGNSIADLNKWDKKFKNRFFIVSKSTGKPFSSVEIRAESQFFYFHFINCWELKTDDVTTHLVVDILTYPNNDIILSNMIADLRTGNQVQNCLPQPQRFVIPLLESLTGVTEGVNLNENLKHSGSAVRDGKVIVLRPENLTLPGIEFPTINHRYLGKPYKYFYGTSFFDTVGPHVNSIVKVDTTTGEVLKYSEAEGVVISEGLFVANPDGNAEDDGILIATVSKGQANSGDYLLFLDAKNMQEIARATFKAALPLSSHGVFIGEGP